MHVVRKESSNITKLHAVFDAFAISSTGVCLNDTLLVGPTMHSSLHNVLLHFRLYHIALTADVSRMYCAVFLDSPDKNLHHFFWHSSPPRPLCDYQMTHVTFGVAASFTMNMVVKQNPSDLSAFFWHSSPSRPLCDYQMTHLTFGVAASFTMKMAVKQIPSDLAHQYSVAASYVDYALIGADSVEEAMEHQQQLQNLFDHGGFTLRKYNSSNPMVLQHLSDEFQCSAIYQMPQITWRHLVWSGILSWITLDCCSATSFSCLIQVRAHLRCEQSIRCVWILLAIYNQNVIFSFRNCGN